MGQRSPGIDAFLDEFSPILGAFGQALGPAQIGSLVFSNVNGGSSEGADATNGWFLLQKKILVFLLDVAGSLPAQETARLGNIERMAFFVPAPAPAQAPTQFFARRTILFLVALGRLFRHGISALAAALAPWLGFVLCLSSWGFAPAFVSEFFLEFVEAAAGRRSLGRLEDQAFAENLSESTLELRNWRVGFAIGSSHGLGLVLIGHVAVFGCLLIAHLWCVGVAGLGCVGGFW